MRQPEAADAWKRMKGGAGRLNVFGAKKPARKAANPFAAARRLKLRAAKQETPTKPAPEPVDPTPDLESRKGALSSIIAAVRRKEGSSAKEESTNEVVETLEKDPDVIAALGELADSENVD